MDNKVLLLLATVRISLHRQRDWPVVYKLSIRCEGYTTLGITSSTPQSVIVHQTLTNNPNNATRNFLHSAGGK